jgi:Tol biopolymer transport system component
MGESSAPREDRLNSWKDIAAHFNRDVTTVQRWEKREGMPVHRHLHDRMGSVYASRAELESWARGRNLRATHPNGNSVSSPNPPAGPPGPAPSSFRTRWRLVLPLAAAAAGAGVWLQKTEYLWRNPLAGARFQLLTDFDGIEQAAAVSRAGHFVAFLSDRDGQMDVWVTQAGSGEFHNLTRGSASDLVNPQIRSLGFSPDGSVVTFWYRRQLGPGERSISIWAAPTLGGEPRPYLEGVAEFDWSRDGPRLVYHTPASGDPIFVSDGSQRPGDRPIFTAPAGIHCHFPVWAPDGAFIYFVYGFFPDRLDIWRIAPAGGSPERITSHNARVSHPVLLDRRTLMYLASDPDGSGPWLYQHGGRTPHSTSADLRA